MAKDELLAVAASLFVVDDDAGGPEENASEEPVGAVAAAGGGAANMVDSYTRNLRLGLHFLVFGVFAGSIGADLMALAAT